MFLIVAGIVLMLAGGVSFLDQCWWSNPCSVSSIWPPLFGLLLIYIGIKGRKSLHSSPIRKSLNDRFGFALKVILLCTCVGVITYLLTSNSSGSFALSVAIALLVATVRYTQTLVRAYKSGVFMWFIAGTIPTVYYRDKGPIWFNFMLITYGLLTTCFLCLSIYGFTQAIAGKEIGLLFRIF